MILLKNLSAIILLERSGKVLIIPLMMLGLVVWYMQEEQNYAKQRRIDQLIKLFTSGG